MNYYEQSLNWFRAQDRNRKASLLGGLSLIFALTITLVWWTLSPDYGVLFSQLDTHDASQILTQLEQADITYQVRNQGRDILISKSLIDKTRIKLMGNDLALTHSVGFELFDKTDFGMTDFSQKINYQRALQGELERTISSLDEVKQARVHLVIPENHLFQQENNVPRVAVTLHLTHPLTTQQIKSIQQLIAATVANLPLTNVIMVDQNGNSLTASEDDESNAHFANKKRVETYLNDKVMQLLNRIFVHNNVMVKIDVTLNYDELQRDMEKPQHEAFLTHEKESQHSRNTDKTDKKQPINQDFSREKSYQFGREKERFIRANGTIERLTISVVLPKKTEKEQILQVERLVKSMVGFDAKRGDSISVEALIVNTKPARDRHLPLATTAPSSRYLVYAAMTGLLLLFSAGLLLHVRNRARRRQHLLTELRQWLIEHG